MTFHTPVITNISKPYISGRLFEQLSWVLMDSQVYYNDVILSAIVYSNVYWATDQRKHHSSASLAFARGIHRWPVNSPQRASNAEKMSIWQRHHDLLHHVSSSTTVECRPTSAYHFTSHGVKKTKWRLLICQMGYMVRAQTFVHITFIFP